MAVSKKTFFAGWELLLDNFRQARKDMTLAGLHLALVNHAPELTDDQFMYAVGQCLVSSTFMPSLNEVLRQVYAPSEEGMPSMPDIDPRYANDYELAAYNKALNIQNDWKAKNGSKPAIGTFREDRIEQIPGATKREKLTPAAAAAGDFLGFDDGRTRKPIDQQEEELELERRKRRLISEAQGWGQAS